MSEDTNEVELVKGGQGRSDKATAESVWMVAACA